MVQANPIEPETASLPKSTESPSVPGQDWEALHREDQAAGTAVATIMVVIFILAVLGYTIVALLAASGPS